MFCVFGVGTSGGVGSAWSVWVRLTNHIFFWWFWRHHQWFNGVKVKLVGPARKLSRVKHRGIGWESQITFFCSCGASTACWVGQHGWRHWRQHGWLSGGQTRCVGWDSQVTIFCACGATPGGWTPWVGGGTQQSICFLPVTKTPHVECFTSGSTDGITDGWVGANTVRRVVRLTNKISFPTCQVRVVRFYQNCCPPPPPLPPPPPHLLLLRLLLAVQIPVGTAAPPPRAPDPSGHCRTPTASCRSQWAQPDLHRELQIPVALPDPNRELHIAVGTAGPQPRLPGRSGHCRTSTGRKDVR